MLILYLRKLKKKKRKKKTKQEEDTPKIKVGYLSFSEGEVKRELLTGGVRGSFLDGDI